MGDVYLNKHCVERVEAVNEGVKLIMATSLFIYRPPKPVTIFKCGEIILTWEMGKIPNKLEKYSNLPLTQARDYELMLNGVPIIKKYEVEMEALPREIRYFNSCIIPYDSVEDLKSRKTLKKYMDKIEMMRILGK